MPSPDDFGRSMAYLTYNDAMPPTIVVDSKEHLVSLIHHEMRANGVHCSLNHLDVSNVTDMSGLFDRFERFNGDISLWDVSNAKTMESMFRNSQFNGDISTWDVSNVGDMSGMFQCSKFNGDISAWNTARVRSMNKMFERSVFTGDLSKWNVANVSNASAMFEQSLFDGDLSQWDTRALCCGYAKFMFKGSRYSGDLSHWSLEHSRVMFDAFDKDFKGVLPHPSLPVSKKFYENLFGGQKELGRYLRKQPFSGAHFDVLRKSKSTIFLVPQELHAWSHQIAQMGLAIGMDDNTLRDCAMEQYRAKNKDLAQPLQVYRTDGLVL